MQESLVRKILVFGAGVLLVSIAVSPLVSSGVSLSTRRCLSDPDKNIMINLVGLKTIIVPDDYPTIQEAIDHANHGDTILVREGTYNENIVVDKMLIIKSEKGPFKTFINGGRTGSVVKTLSDGVDISGFTIQSSGRYDAGIHLASHYNTIRYNIIQHNYYGLKLFPSTGNQITNNTIRYNSGDGLWASHSHANIIDHNNISSNGKDGIFANLSSFSNNITRNYIGDNEGNGIKIAETSFGNTFQLNVIANNAIGLNTVGGSDNNLYFINDVSLNDQNANDNSMNSYDNSEMGNHWSDFDEPSEGAWDNDSDGIVDSPYPVPGGDNEDGYPLVESPTVFNYPPITPHPPDGPYKGNVWAIYTFTVDIDDPDINDFVYCQFSWGDGKYSDWIGPQKQGSRFTDIHSWWRQGQYHIKARGMDQWGVTSDWSEAHPIQIPRGRDVSDQVNFFNLLHRLFPFLDINDDEYSKLWQTSLYPFFLSLFSRFNNDS